MPDIFISYSRHNIDAANAFAELLRGAGLDVFIDYERMQGDNFPARIAHEIENSRFLLFLVSQQATESKWVKREVQYADSQSITTLVLRLDGTKLPKELFFLEYTDYIDATRWNASAPIPAAVSEKLGRALNVTLNAATARPVAPTLPAPTITPPPQPTGPTFTVAKYGTPDFRSITEAIQQVPEGATIKVRPGLYRESVKLTKAVELIGEGDRDDILIESADADVLWMDTDNAIVRGLTLRQTGADEVYQSTIYIPKGRLILEDCTITSSSWSGINVANAGTDPVIRRCRIHHCNQDGIRVNENAMGIFEDCDMVDNGSCGIVLSTGANPTLRRCRMSGNKGWGAFVYESGTGSFEDCHIFNNDIDGFHAGVSIYKGSNPILRGCTISGNKGPGVYAHDNARGTVENCDLRGNEKGAFSIDATSQLVRRNNREG